MATSYGRRFSGSGGVAASVQKAVKELGFEEPIKARACNGVKAVSYTHLHLVESPSALSGEL